LEGGREMSEVKKHGRKVSFSIVQRGGYLQKGKKPRIRTKWGMDAKGVKGRKTSPDKGQPGDSPLLL